MKKPAGLRILLAATCCFLILTPAAAAEAAFTFEELEIFYDMLWLGNSDSDSAPSPILGVWGAAGRFHLTPSFSFRPELGLYGVEYFYRDGKAYPAEIEYRDAVGTLCVMPSFPVVYRYPLAGGRFSAGGGIGPALSFKIPLVSHGDSPNSEVTGYFYDKLRFFHLEIRGFFDWNVTEAIGLTVRFRSLLPLFHLWDGEGSPFYDQLMIGGGIGLRLRF